MIEVGLTLQGRHIHKNFINKTFRHFSEKGYTVIKEAKMSGKSRIDLLAIKGSERIGVECQLKISYKIIKQKLRDYRTDLTQMLFVIPKYRETKMKNVLNQISEEDKLPKNFFEIWTEPVVPMTTIRIEKKTKARLDEFGTKADTYDDIVGRLIREFERNNKVRKR